MFLNHRGAIIIGDSSFDEEKLIYGEVSLVLASRLFIIPLIIAVIITGPRNGGLRIAIVYYPLNSCHEKLVES